MSANCLSFFKFMAFCFFISSVTKTMFIFVQGPGDLAPALNTDK